MSVISAALSAAKRSPVAITTCPSFPTVNVPTISSTPNMFAGAVVTAANASAGARPRFTAKRTPDQNCESGCFRPEVVKAMGTPRAVSFAALAGASSQCCRVESNTSTAFSGVSISGTVGKFNGTITGVFAAASAPTTRYSVPRPRKISFNLNSSAIFWARKRSSSSCASITTGSVPFAAAASASKDAFASGRAVPDDFSFP